MPFPFAEDLASPHGRVLFAGEATSKRMSTTTGAHLSGKREARRLISMISKMPVVVERAAVTGK
jgi:monoamine oxidase